MKRKIAKVKTDYMKAIAGLRSLLAQSPPPPPKAAAR